MTRYYCPFCGKDELDWTRFEDSVIWTSEEAGVIETRGLFCKDQTCNGSLGFTVKVGFLTDDDVGYYDDEGREIE